MNKRIYLLKFALLVLLLFSIGCAHTISITPDLSNINQLVDSKIEVNVGNYISKDDLSKKVVDRLMNGDSVKYASYKEVEPAFVKVLSNIFENVIYIQSLEDIAFIKESELTYIFVPTIETRAFTYNPYAWPPTDFEMTLACYAIDESTKKMWEWDTHVSQKSKYSEYWADQAISGKKAVIQCLNELQEELRSTDIFRDM